MSQNKVRIAIVGGGAIAERQHLPRLTRRNDCLIVALVERNERRAAWLAKSFSIPHISTTYRDLIELNVDAAVVALPSHLHASVSTDLLRAGIHTLVEKPMALSVAECDTMIEAADDGRAALAVGLMRRFSHSGRFAKWAIESDLLGRIISFDIRDGFIYTWPITTDFFLRKELAGGGVLMDLGVHTLDQLLWLLGDVASFEYYDDNYGGIEADCILHAVMKSGAAGVVEVSRTRDLRNTAIIRGERAQLEIGLVKNSVSLRYPDASAEITAPVTFLTEPTHHEQRAADLIAAEHEDFLTAIRTGRPPVVSGVEGRRSIALVEACYAQRQLLRLPWLESQSAPVKKEGE